MSIGIFDSGLGGAILTNKISKKIKNQDLIFVADINNFPYGNKSSSQLTKIALDITNFIISNGNIKAIVIACNTASVAALNQIKRMTNLPIINPINSIFNALKLNKFNKVAIIATSFTIKSNYYQNKIKQIVPQTSLLPIATPYLAQSIEDNFSKKININKNYIKNIAQKINQSSINALILGSTHYSAIKENISLYLNNDIKIIDLGDLMLDELKTIFPKEPIQNRHQKENDLKIFLTRESKDFNISISRVFPDQNYSVELKKI